jgi:hypothetical protein
MICSVRNRRMPHIREIIRIFKLGNFMLLQVSCISKQFKQKLGKHQPIFLIFEKISAESTNSYKQMHYKIN